MRDRTADTDIRLRGQPCEYESYSLTENERAFWSTLEHPRKTTEEHGERVLSRNLAARSGPDGSSVRPLGKGSVGAAIPSQNGWHSGDQAPLTARLARRGADTAGTVHVTADAHREEGFDRVWLRNAVTEPVEESGAEVDR